jgi:hypothetical protein
MWVRTGVSTDDFAKRAEAKEFTYRGKLNVGITGAEIVKWLEQDFGLEHSHAMAVYAVSAWLGGHQQLGALTRTFHERFGSDPVLAPVLTGRNPMYPEHAVAFITEVFGGGGRM